MPILVLPDGQRMTGGIEDDLAHSHCAQVAADLSAAGFGFRFKERGDFVRGKLYDVVLVATGERLHAVGEGMDACRSYRNRAAWRMIHKMAADEVDICAAGVAEFCFVREPFRIDVAACVDDKQIAAALDVSAQLTGTDLGYAVLEPGRGIGGVDADGAG